jgi:hypothetical protein
MWAGKAPSRCGAVAEILWGWVWDFREKSSRGPQSCNNFIHGGA